MRPGELDRTIRIVQNLLVEYRATEVDLRELRNRVQSLEEVNRMRMEQMLALVEEIKERPAFPH